MIKAIIFDMDGVLVNTPKYVWITHNKLLSDFEKHVSDSKIPAYLGQSLVDQITMFEKNLDIKIDRGRYMKRFEIEMQSNLEHIEKNNSLMNLIKKLKKKFKLAVATSSSTQRCEDVLQHLGILDYFDVIITSEHVKRHKPYPDIFLKAAEKLGIRPEDCIVIEDAPNGIEAAKRADMKVVGLVTAFVSAKELKKAGADYILNDLKNEKHFFEVVGEE